MSRPRVRGPRSDLGLREEGLEAGPVLGVEPGLVAQGRACSQQGVADPLRPTVLEERYHRASSWWHDLSEVPCLLAPGDGNDLVGFLREERKRRWRASVGRRDRELPIIVHDALERIHAANRTVRGERHERAQDGASALRIGDADDKHLHWTEHQPSPTIRRRISSYSFGVTYPLDRRSLSSASWCTAGSGGAGAGGGDGGCPRSP